jgi:MFS family permease
MAQPSPFLSISFAALGLLLASAFPLGLYWAGRRLGRGAPDARRVALLAGAGAAVWLGVTVGAAAGGALTFSGTPPTMVLLLVAMFALAVGLGRSRVGERLALGLPLPLLVGVQGFRLPLELLMHRAYTEGLMPVQMSYSGFNFDIFTGASALVVAALLLAGRMPLWGVRLWNWVGLALLVNIVVIANLSTPTPMRVFMNEPANTWILHPPFVWLPAVMVLSALLGHIVVFRRLRASERPDASAGKPMREGNSAPPALTNA